MIEIFVLCTGQEDNIGDVVLRRTFLDELRACGELRVYLGPASPGFIDSLRLAPSDRAYASKKAWRRDAWRAVMKRRTRTWIVDKPGEVVVNPRLFVAQARLWPLMLLAKIQGGRLLRSGLGFRSGDNRKQWLYAQTFRGSDVVQWRDDVSQKIAGRGTVIPDWGFWEGSNVAPGPRDRLVLSYRSDRPMPSAEALEGVLAAASEHRLRVTVVTQVQRDSPRSEALAAALGAELVDWPAGVTHRAQEDRLRAVYAKTRLVVSDRLHVLIVAFAEGAAPLCLVEWEENKINRHFRPVGRDEVSRRISGEEWAGSLRAALGRSIEPSSPPAEVLESLRGQLRCLR